ncbi:Cytochrome oxidase assembly, variant 2 [Basidiobolus ranarum]|uniref:Cytochrome c oxidase assembly protein COX16, mitochondrial n=1 Tax=Basidiobolus ranarum TaxID=34480 RepID=A0ABR2W4C1_9FUNG
MPFVNRRSNSYPLASIVRKYPFITFGVPFLTVIVGGSFLLSQMTQTRYDFHDHKVNAVSTEEKLHLDKNRRKFSLQEEYWVRNQSINRKTSFLLTMFTD